MKKYNIIYADPAWKFGNRLRNGTPESNGTKNIVHRQLSETYDVMTINDICALKVNEIADKDCVLFMWATAPLLPEALFTIKSWGFEYKTIAFTWIKKNKKSTDTNFWGMGSWTRSNPEYCLLATKGNPKAISHSVHSVIETPIEQHSKKPDIVRDKIVELCGDLPRIELFARNKCEGWDSLGNQLDK